MMTILYSILISKNGRNAYKVAEERFLERFISGVLFSWIAAEITEKARNNGFFKSGTNKGQYFIINTEFFL